MHIRVAPNQHAMILIKRVLEQPRHAVIARPVVASDVLTAEFTFDPTGYRQARRIGNGRTVWSNGRFVAAVGVCDSSAQYRSHDESRCNAAATGKRHSRVSSIQATRRAWRRFKCTSSSEIAAGVTPEMRIA